MRFTTSRTISLTLFVVILLLGTFFRLYGLNWDQNQHLHPDERFLTMVGNAMRLPTSLSHYLDPATSSLNPPNIGFSFFVYGTFPLIFNKVIAVFLNTDNYTDYTLQGRVLAGFIDLVTLVAVYALAKTVATRHKLPPSTSLWAMLLYALSVLPIQLSHFFAVDPFLSCFMFLSFLFAYLFYLRRSPPYIVLSAITIGLAFASKLNALYLLPVPLLVIGTTPLLNSFQKKNKHTHQLKPILQGFGYCALYCLITYCTLRFADPYKFAEPNWLNPTIHPQFAQSIESLKSFEDPGTYFPPAIQWIGKPPVTYALKNMVILGWGLPAFVAIFVGFVTVNIATLKDKKDRLLTVLIVSWIVVVFFYQSTQFVKALRYFIFLYPFLAVIGGIGISYCQKYIPKKLVIGFCILVITALAVWPLMFLNIYTKPHSRVEASQWIYDNLTPGPVVNELWDDPLPLLLPTNHGKAFNGEMMPVFDPDTPEKWQRLNQYLQNANYYFLTSNRAWGSIMTHPEKYPQMSKFYQDLFAGRTSFKRIAEFTRYPSLEYLGIPLTLNDDWADETFTVYDHPKVLLFQK